MVTHEQLDEDYPDFDYTRIIAETEKGICFEMEDSIEGLWLPLSQVEYDESNNTFNIPKWLAKKHNLI